MKRSFQAAALACCTAAACMAQAQSYPSKPVLAILPLQAGSAGDIAMRVVAQKMSETMKQQFVIENQPGASGLIGIQRLIRAAPDGYTIGGLGDNVINYAPSLSDKPGFDPVSDFAPVSLVCLVPWVLVAHPSLPAKDVRGFITLAKSMPGRIDFSSGGNGTAQQVAMELFKRATAIDLRHIPYRGAAQAVLDVVGGQVPVTFAATAIPLPHVKSGKLRALAVPSEKRSPQMPEVPTLIEAGVPGFVFETWLGVFAPRATPKPVVDRLNAEIAAAIGDPAVRERLAGLALDPRGSTPEELGRRNREGYARIAKIIRDAGIKAD